MQAKPFLHSLKPLGRDPITHPRLQLDALGKSSVVSCAINQNVMGEKCHGQTQDYAS